MKKDIVCQSNVHTWKESCDACGTTIHEAKGFKSSTAPEEGLDFCIKCQCYGLGKKIPNDKLVDAIQKKTAKINNKKRK